MTINLDQYTNTLSVTDTAANADLNVTTKGTGVVNLNTGNGVVFKVTDSGATSVDFIQAASTSFSRPSLVARPVSGSGTINFALSSFGVGSIQFNTNNLSQEQMRVSHTASAVNYVQVTGGSTGNDPTLSVQGSDTNINFAFVSKGSSIYTFASQGGSNRQFRIDGTSASVNYLNVSGSGTGSAPVLSALGSDTNIAQVFQSKGTGSLQFQTNAGAQEQLRISHTASAVNYVQVTGAATGSRPTISAQGSDANAGLNIVTKGSSGIFLGANLGNSYLATFAHSTSAVNYLQITNSATTVAPTLTAQGSDTNIPLVLQPKGTGALQAQQTDSTATGGNARGPNAVDFQTSRTAAFRVASGANSFIGSGNENFVTNSLAACVAGNANAVTGYSSFIGAGNSNTASNVYSSVTTGVNNVASGFWTTVVNGTSNTAAGFYNFIGNGQSNSGTSGSAVTTQSATMNGTTAVTLSGSNASIKVGQYITGTSIAGDTYVAAISGTSLTLSQAASGSSTSTLSFYTPHGVVVGGGNNTATGSYSFIGGGGDAGTAGNRNVASGDWSTVAGGINNKATGLASFVGGGGYDGTAYGNTASGTASSVIGGIANVASGAYSNSVGGAFNTANGSFSTILGSIGTTRSITGNIVFSPQFGAVSYSSGNAQLGLLILGRQTTDATATRLTCDGGAGSTTNQVILPNNSAYFFTGEVVAGVTGGGNTKGWTIEGVIKRGANAASTALVGTPTVTSTYADAGASTWVIAVTADTTNGGLAVTFTGQASTTIRTVCQIRSTEMTY